MEKMKVTEWQAFNKIKTVFSTKGEWVHFQQGSYASGKCQGNLKFFKVRELSGNFIICQGKLNFC